MRMLLDQPVVTIGYRLSCSAIIFSYNVRNIVRATNLVHAAYSDAVNLNHVTRVKVGPC